jgi:hypothetical protein
MSKEYESRATSWAVLPKGESLFSEMATVITIDDEAGGEFVTVEQSSVAESRKIAFNPEEWPAIRAAIDHAISKCRPDKDDEVGA